MKGRNNIGTNYYLWSKQEPPTYETLEEGMHIGKNSAGWVFHFQSYPYADTLMDMRDLTQKGAIYDEYLKEYSYEEFWDKVEATKVPYCGQEPYILIDPDYPNDIDFGSYEESGFAWTPSEFC